MSDTLASVAGVVARTLVVYAAVVIGLRLVGKRELGQLGVPDLVVLLLVSSAVQNAMVGADASVPGGLASAATLLVANLGVARLRARSRRIDRLVEGVPTVLVKDGAVVQRNLDHEGVDRDELDSAIREHGLERLDDVRLAVLEPDGSVSVIPATAPVLRGRRRVRAARGR